MAKVLLVEDDNNLREIYEARLQAEGYTIVSAQDGEAALVIAKQERPDLIISDVMMPKISGFEMLDILRNTDGLKDVKIIMLTALGQAEDKTRADALGANKYLVKSQVTLEDIVKTAHQLLDDDATPAPAEPAAAPATPVAQQPVAPMPVATEPTPTIPVATAPDEPAAPAADASAPASTPVADATTTVPAEPVTAPPDDTVAQTPSAAVDNTPAAAPVDEAVSAEASDKAETTAQEQAQMQADIDKFEAQPASPAPTVEPATPGTAASAPEATTPETPAPTVTPAASVEPTANATESTSASETATANAASDQQLVTSAVDSLVADTAAQKPSEVTAVEVSPPADAPAPTDEPTAPASETAIPAPNIPVSESGDGVSIAHKKVIQPINDLNQKTDINDLLAKEVARSAVPTAEPTSTVPPAPAPPAAPTDTADPNNIAL